MIRQPFTDETIPFKSHIIQTNQTNVIQATDFDLGKNGFAYYDTYATNTSGKPGGARWNLGMVYRNDGVDIRESEEADPASNGYQVSWTEAGEWMQYTFEVKSTGKYDLQLRYASENASAIRIEIDGKELKKQNQLSASGGAQQWKTTKLGKVKLTEGTHQMKVYILQGGLNLTYFEVK
jgi:hypothetical protein